MQIKKARLLEERQNFMTNTFMITVFDQDGTILTGSPLIFSKNAQLMHDMDKLHVDRIHYLAEVEAEFITSLHPDKTHKTC